MAVSVASRAIVVGNWRLDEGQGNIAGDSTGERNKGQLGPTNTLLPTWIGGRKPNSTALHFDGQTFVKVANTPHLAVLELSKISAEAWVRSSNPGINGYIISKGAEDCQEASYALFTGPNGGLLFYISERNNIRHFSPDAGKSIWDGTWHHIAGTYDGNTISLYVDGKEIDGGNSVSTSIEYELPSKDYYIGAFIGTCQLHFTGDIAEVRIWNDALTSNEVLQRSHGYEL